VDADDHTVVGSEKPIARENGRPRAREASTVEWRAGSRAQARSRGRVRWPASRPRLRAGRIGGQPTDLRVCDHVALLGWLDRTPVRRVAVQRTMDPRRVVVGCVAPKHP
jgi:hypothetical protein